MIKYGNSIQNFMPKSYGIVRVCVYMYGIIIVPNYRLC